GWHGSVAVACAIETVKGATRVASQGRTAGGTVRWIAVIARLVRTSVLARMATIDAPRPVPVKAPVPVDFEPAGRRVGRIHCRQGKCQDTGPNKGSHDILSGMIASVLDLGAGFHGSQAHAESVQALPINIALPTENAPEGQWRENTTCFPSHARAIR